MGVCATTLFRSFPVNMSAPEWTRPLIRLSLSVGKAAWLASTTLLVLLVPLVIEMDREAQLLEMEKEQMSVLTSPKS